MTSTEKTTILTLIAALINYSSFSGDFPFTDYENDLLTKLRKEAADNDSQ